MLHEQIYDENLLFSYDYHKCMFVDLLTRCIDSPDYVHYWVYCALFISNSEGGLIMHMGNQSVKVILNFTLRYESSTTKRSRKHCSSQPCSLKVPVFFILSLFTNNHVHAYSFICITLRASHSTHTFC
jgi:hypothetical protein